MFTIPRLRQPEQATAPIRLAVMLGALVTRDDELYGVLKGRRDLVGAIPGTLEAWLALRGLRTLHLRVERAQANAQELVRRLADHPAVGEVRYPGFGGLLSFDVADADAARRVETSTALIENMTSLGGVTSRIEARARWEGDRVPPGLLRLSVGLEDADALWSDLERALGPT